VSLWQTSLRLVSRKVAKESQRSQRRIQDFPVIFERLQNIRRSQTALQMPLSTTGFGVPGRHCKCRSAQRALVFPDGIANAAQHNGLWCSRTALQMPLSTTGFGVPGRHCKCRSAQRALVFPNGIANAAQPRSTIRQLNN